MTASREVFHSFAKGMCPACRELVDAQRILRDGMVFMRKMCPRDGMSEGLISRDADWFLRSLSFIKPGQIPLARSTESAAGCPKDCGLCPGHEQHTCMPVIEITNRCELDCPICLVRNENNWDMTRDEFAGVIRGLIEKEGTLDTINLSGGEPTRHAQLLEFLDIAARPEIGRISISTNGLRIAADPGFCRELARRGVYVSLQLDSLRDEDTIALRGGGAGSKRRALANLEEAGVRTTLVCTVVRGVNDDRIGDCLNLLFERDFILSLMFQPAAYTGSGGSHFKPHDPLDIVTIPDVIRGAEAQSGGRLLRSDFLPLPCSHPSCFALTYLLKTADGYVPFPRFIETGRYAQMMANRGTIRPDEKFEDAIRGTIDELWTGSAQIPDSDRILQTLRKALTAMYPAGRPLPIQERQRAGEALVKTIFIHAFMDEHTFDAERIRKCCTHYALPDGRLMPGCSYNMFHRHKDPRFAGAARIGPEVR